MINLALTKQEAQDEACISPSDQDLPKYPYGLSLYLDDETLEKLGITDLPKVGSVMMAQIKLTVTGTSQRATQSSKEEDGSTETTTSCVDMQITDMDIAQQSKSVAETLYPTK